jgi:hypothetical protein
VVQRHRTETQRGGKRAMVASILVDAVKFVVLFAAVIAVIFVFPFLMMVVFRRIFLGNPDGPLSTIRRVK